MILNLDKSFDRQKFRSYCEHLLSKRVYAEIKERKKPRSSAQNRYLHVCIGIFAAEYGYDMETAKYDFFKREVNKDIFQRTRKNKHGHEVTYLRSSTDLDTGEMTTAIERWRNWCAMLPEPIYIPEPHETDALLEAERWLDSYKEFL